LSNPLRLVIDIDHCQFAANLQHLSLIKSTLKGIRSSEHHQMLRIVFDLNQRVTPNSFLIPAYKQFKPRLVIDLLANTKGGQNKSEVKNSRDVVKSMIAAPKLTKQNTEETNGSAKTSDTTRFHTVKAGITLPAHSRNIIVVIDPGHGGKDPGATGPSGIHEKDVVLAIAKDLRNRLNQVSGIHAVLTRNQDYFISLRGRLRIARQNKADLFIAIHADAYRKTNSEGASVFALSERGASSEAARWLATRENYSELGGVEDFSDKSRLVRSVLLDLSQTVTIAQSLQMGKTILNSLQQLTSLHYDVVEQARFVVLKSPDIPSLLVETGFITNPLEEQRLSDSDYENQLAKALTKGIEKYFALNPPPGTYFWAQKEKDNHIFYG
jgi:N-acetylmuramoyl-L-alanine amidase